MRGGLETGLDRAIAGAVGRGERLLPAEVGSTIARELGLAVPRSVEVEGVTEARDLDLSAFRGDRLVVKMLSTEAGHKSDLGGVVFCAGNAAALERAIESIRRSVGDRARIDGYSVGEVVDFGREPGAELLLGARWTDDFGPVAALGLGGLDVERLSAGGPLEAFLLGSAQARSGPLLPSDHALIRFLTEPYRGRPPRFERGLLEDLLSRLLEFAARWMSPGREHRLAELEFNPVVMHRRRPVALDALVRPATRSLDVAPARPLAKLERLLRPSSIAVAGVSRRGNIGRVIVGNILRQGFDPGRLWVVKPGLAELDGCRCVPSFDELPETVDLAVLAVAAEGLPDLVQAIAAGRRAESLILVSGGVGEREGSESIAGRLEGVIRGARDQEGGGPIVNGGNCLGVRSVPGRYDTLFIPGHKLRFAAGEPAPLALLAQSGAFAVARASRLEAINPRYVVTFGNQLDLTLADYLTHLASNSSISVFACYVEGFRPLDGGRFLEAVEAITGSGRTVILYRAGRTAAGARAAASHTASVAGSYRVTRELTRRAGGLVADSIEDFDDLVRTFCALAPRRPAGRRLGAVSNAGFESVAIGDNLNGLELAKLGTATEARLTRILREARIDSIVAPRNPLDVTPVLDDGKFVEAAAELLEDERVDLGLIGCVPLTGALQTLPAGDGHREDLERATAVGRRLAELWRATAKPWVAVVDAGSLYDPFARSLAEAGIPTFRSVDRALAALASWAGRHLRRT